MDRRFDFPVPLYDSTLTVVVLDGVYVDSMDDFHASLRALDIPNDDDDEDPELFPLRALTWDAHYELEPRPFASKGRWVVAITRNVNPEILAHEALHVTLMLARWHGLHVSSKPKHHEQLTYVQGWVTARLHEALDRSHETV